MARFCEPPPAFCLEKERGAKRDSPFLSRNSFFLHAGFPSPLVLLNRPSASAPQYQGQRQWSALTHNAAFSLAHISELFRWRGTRDLRMGSGRSVEIEGVRGTSHGGEGGEGAQ